MSWRWMKWFLGFGVLLTALANISACSQDGRSGIVGPNDEYWADLYDWSDPGIWTDPSQWSDNKLRSFAYSGVRAIPGFYQEDYSRGSPYYENTISTRMESGKWIELSTSTRDSAFALSETSSITSAYYRDIESESETEKFFEFRRVYSENPRDVILSRVHKRSYLDRSMHDRLHPSPVLGVYKERPITEIGAQELIEYMWVNSRIISYGRPLSRGLEETKSSFVEEIYYSYSVGGDWGICDMVVLGRALVRVDKVTGEVTSEVEELREIDGVCYE